MHNAEYYWEYPTGYQGRKRYVRTASHGIVAACFVYTGFDGRYYIQGDKAGIAPTSDLAAPYVMGDIGQYQSPLDGSMVTSRSAHREHLKAHGVIEVGNERMPSPRPDIAPEGGIGEGVKRHVAEVLAMPQDTYDNHVRAQAAEKTAIADLITA